MNDSENYYQKNLDLWQRFGESYAENLIATFEKNLDQSQVFQEQVHKAVADVVDSQFNLALSGLKTLENQSARLANSIDEFLTTDKTK